MSFINHSFIHLTNILDYLFVTSISFVLCAINTTWNEIKYLCSHGLTLNKSSIAKAAQKLPVVMQIPSLNRVGARHYNLETHMFYRKWYCRKLPMATETRGTWHTQLHLILKCELWQKGVPVQEGAKCCSLWLGRLSKHPRKKNCIT